MTRANIILSDLHLGRGNNLDSFVDRREGVRRFGEELAAWARAMNAELTLVLNGDVFDLWEIVPDEQLEPTEAGYDAICRNLIVPTGDAAGIDRMVEAVWWQLEEALGAHDDVVAMWRAIAGTGARIHFNVGNHDHQLDHVRTQAVLIRSLTDRGIAAPGQLSVGRYFHDTQLRVYAEHGDQFAGPESRAPLGEPDGEVLAEPPGFYFLRLVWNRFTNQWPDIQHFTTATIVELVVEMLFQRGRPVELLKRLVGDYFRAKRDFDIALVGHPIVAFLYQRWLRRNPRRPAAVADEDIEAARQQQDARQPRAVEGRSAEVEMLAAVEVAPPARLPLPGIEIAPKRAAVDDYVRGLRGRFIASGDGFPLLQERDVALMTVGHTHDERRVLLHGHRPPLYFNSGSWTRGNRLLYVWAVANEDGHWSGLRQVR